MSESLTTTANDKPWRFQRGNKAAVGHQASGFKLREAIRKVTKPADVKAVFEELTIKAKAGDMAAVKLFLAYAVGEPSQIIDLTHHTTMDIPAAVQALLASSASLAAELQLDVQYLGEKS
jgi:hypothetical protein